MVSTLDKSKRKKTFSHKVRTGCSTCKSRRIKCDEHKPECLRCLKSGLTCSGYDSSDSWIFKAAKIPSAAKSNFNVIDVRGPNQNQDKEFHFTRPMTSASLELVSQTYEAIHLIQPTAFPYESVEDKAAFGFWLSWTGPMLNGYGPNGELWNVVIPQLTWTCPTIRQLLLATVACDEQWLKTVNRRPTDLAHRALTHYSSALKDVVNGRTSKLETLVASLMAWTMEVMMFDYEGGAIHLKGARKLLSELECDQKYTHLVKQIRSALNLAEGYNTIMRPTKPISREAPWISKHPSSLTVRANRDELSNFLTAYHCIPVQRRPNADEMLLFLREWENKDRLCRYMNGEPQITKECLHLLWNIAIALLPKDRVLGFSYDVNVETVQFVLGRVDAALRERGRLTKLQREDLEQTLRVVLGHLFELFPQIMRWEKHDLLVREMARKHPEAFDWDLVLNTGSTNSESGLASTERSSEIDSENSVHFLVGAAH